MNQDGLNTTKEYLIKSILTTNRNSQLNWFVFKEEFNKLYPNFFTSIFMKDIDLSMKEERLIMLEKLHINTHTIARVLDVLPESVYTSRYRLNKKFKKKQNSKHYISMI